jgi:hypothetical protein
MSRDTREFIEKLLKYDTKLKAGKKIPLDNIVSGMVTKRENKEAILKFREITNLKRR